MIKYKQLNSIISCHNHYKENHTSSKMINRSTISNKRIKFYKKNSTKLFNNHNLICINKLIKNHLVLLIISLIYLLNTNLIYNVHAYKYESTTTTTIFTSNLENYTQPKTTKLNIITTSLKVNNNNSNTKNIYKIYNNSTQNFSSLSSVPILNSIAPAESLQFQYKINDSIINSIPFKPSTYYSNIENFNENITQPIKKTTTESVKSTQATEQNKNWQQNNEKSKFNIRTGNELWDSIITECYTHPTFSCLQKNVFTYLDKTLDISNINVTNRLLFTKNKVDYKKYTKESNEQFYIKQKQYKQENQQKKEINNYEEKNSNNRVDNDNDNNSNNNKNNDNDNSNDSNYHNDDNKLNEIDNEYEDELENEIPDEGRTAESPIEEVTNALYDKSIKFAMTHDIALRMPEMMFNGATFKVSPRSFEGNGVIVKLELIPKQEIEYRGTGRIFKKKIQNFLKNKLLLSFIAIVLIIKLIKIKLFWLLPILIGVGAAKKLLLKVLLFFFPALAHIFKLCHYYHSNYHQTKYYHHHHLINHHHTSPPTWNNDYSVTLPNGPELIFTQPPKGHIPHHEYGAPSPVHEHYDNWETSGPGLGSEYLSDNIHRNGQIDSYFKPKPEDEDDIKSWGLFNTIPGTTISPPTSQSYKINPFIPKHQSIIANKIRGVGPNLLYVTPLKRLVSTHKTVPPPPPPINLVTAIPNAAQIAAQYDPTIHQQAVHRAQAKVKEALRIQNEQRIIAQQQKILSEEPFVQDGEPIMPKGYDQFYTPILDRMDRIFKQLGPHFDTDYCKERLVCSMYKNPNRYSPQSNFISAELSRDPSELEKPTEMNQSVLRFYRLVQAARDGQEQRDCLRLHPQCSINTE